MPSNSPPSTPSSATATPSGGSTPTLASLLSAATHVVSAHSNSSLDVPSTSGSTSTTPHSQPHSRAHSLLRRSRSHLGTSHSHSVDTNLLLPPSDPDSNSTHHRRFSLHRKHSRARSRSRHDASSLAHADFIAACEARVRERYPDAGEEEVRRRVEEEVEGGLEEAEEFAREEADGALEDRERREKWEAVRAF